MRARLSLAPKKQEQISGRWLQCLDLYHCHLEEVYQHSHLHQWKMLDWNCLLRMVPCYSQREPPHKENSISGKQFCQIIPLPAMSHPNLTGCELTHLSLTDYCMRLHMISQMLKKNTLLQSRMATYLLFRCQLPRNELLLLLGSRLEQGNTIAKVSVN